MSARSASEIIVTFGFFCCGSQPFPLEEEVAFDNDIAGHLQTQCTNHKVLRKEATVCDNGSDV